MKFINCSYKGFLEKLNSRKIVQFGASSSWRYYRNIFPNIDRDVLDRTLCVVDNSKQKQGELFDAGISKLKIESPDILNQLSDYVILLTLSEAYQSDVCSQLVQMNLNENIECYSLPLMMLSLKDADNSDVEKHLDGRADKLLPAKIHSFWFSGEQKPDLYKRCVDSWHKYCPEFEIIEWNSDNYDVGKNQYMLEAYNNRKWAFVSDFARLDVVYRYGGVYLDMDVELVAPLDPFLYADSFFCRQDDGTIDLGSGFGAQSGNIMLGQMLDVYKDRRFILPDGSLDKVAQPELLNSIFIRNGFVNGHDSQVVGDSLVLSNDYITCYSENDSYRKAKLGIHWHNAGWMEDKDRENLKNALRARTDLLNKYFNKQR